MALNIKDPETERLATEVANLSGENKTRAVRTALQERKQRLELAQGGHARRRELLHLLEQEIWPTIPAEARGRPLTKAEEEAMLGLGPEGV